MLKIDKTALVIVDVQGNLAQAMDGKEDLFDNLEKLIKGAKALELPILWAEQLPDKLGRTIPQICELLEGQEPIAKSSFSCCGEGEFSEAIKRSGASQFIVAGIETHVCVYQTVMDLLGQGHEVELAEDATSARAPGNKRIGVEKMKSAGAKITSVEMALFELLQVAHGDKFKQVLKIVK